MPALVFGQSSPEFPHLFYGTSKINGADTSTGTVIIAKVNGVEKGRITSTEIGRYGGPSINQNKLLVQGNIEEGAEIEFYISGVKANEVHSFKSGDVTEKDLTWNFPAIQIAQTSVYNEPITCVPGIATEVTIPGLELNISCDTSTTGTINNITNLGNTYFVGTPGTPASNSIEISISGDFDVIAVMNYNDTGIDESTITVYKFVDGNWVPISSDDIISIDAVNNKITFRVTPGTPHTVFGSSPTTITTTPPVAAVAGGSNSGGGGGSGPVSTTTAPTPTPTTTNAQPNITTTPSPINETITTVQPSAPTNAPATPTEPGNLITGLVTFVSSPTAIGVISIVIGVTIVFYIRKKIQNY